MSERLVKLIEWTKCPFEVRELIHQNQLADTNFNICCPIDTPWIVYGWCIDSVSLSNIDTMKRLNRIVIYPQDVAIITGRSDRYGRMIIKRIKEHLGKEQHQFVTIKEFATYMDIEMSLIELSIFGE